MPFSFNHVFRSVLRTYTLNFPVTRGKGRLVEMTKKWIQAEGPVITKVGSGYVMSLDLTDLVQRGIYYFGYYESDFSHFLGRFLQKGSAFVDAGANVGQFTLLASQAVGCEGRVLAIEPENHNFDQLRKNIALNKLANVTTYQVALSNEVGSASFYTRGAESGFTNRGVHSFHQHDDWINPQKTTVQMSTLDTLLNSEPRVDVIKMDVEGAELLALKGAKSVLHRCEPVIFFEANEICTRYFGHSTAEVKVWLVDQGYRLMRFCGKHFEAVEPGAEPDSMLIAYKQKHEERLYSSL